MKTITVISIKCIGERVMGDRLSENEFKNQSSLYEALDFAETLRGNGVCVIVRPSYNEVDGEGAEFFREWRSFNGGELKEARFYLTCMVAG
jgi:hypothetical protein